MSDSADDPLVLLEILEVLGVCRGRLSYADVCVYLSGRYELQPLLELRSLLYSTACRDPCFPATLFRERLHPPCSNRLSAAADVVSLFNLLTHTRLPPSHTHADQSQATCLACGQGCPRCDWLQAGGGAIAPGSKYEGSTEGLIRMNAEVLHTQTPSHFRAHTHPASHTLNQDSMQSTHSIDIPGECTRNQESSSKVSAAGSDAEPIYSCAQKRSMFKGEFHNLLPFVPMESNRQSEQAQEGVTDGGEDVPFRTYKNPYPDSTVYQHDSATHLHDAPTHAHHLSTHVQGQAANPYVHATQTNDMLTHSQGPAMPMHDPHVHTHAPVAQMHAPSTNVHPTAQTSFDQKHKSLDDLQSSTYFGPTVMERSHQSPAMATKSHSLDIDSRPEEEEKSGLDKNKARRPGSERSVLDKSGLAKPKLAKLSFDNSSFDIPGFDPFIVRSVRDTLKRLSGLSLDAWYDCSPGDGVSNVATQTDPPDRRALRSLMLSDKLSIDNPDIGEDDISAIFRFLDDISMCGSMAVLPGEAGGSQEGGGAGLPERRERLGKLRRLFHSLEGPEEGVRWGVGRLLQRVTELEQRLEPISELREQLALVLATLNRLEQRGKLVHTHSEQLCAHHQAAQGCMPSAQQQQQGSPRPNPELEGAEGAAAKRRGLFTRRASRSHTESSGSEQQREWSVSYSKEQHTCPAQAEQHDRPCKKEAHAAQERRKSSHLIPEAHRAPLHSSMQSSNLRLTDRPKVSWSQTELTPFDLQAPESLDFWMDDVYTPASDTLLRRSQSLTRCSRNQTYRITALSVTATVILILIIVIPICTA
ncbi:major intrinsically disordered Notch2-binding receptor 1 [Colossoma macropomum]|uniref:major intrinsically disordered Notch2-binding receptor 1 n=1 Tax=Colossoma macropomum TaxID=42526 RepID=UPI0018642579|nr:major intrinsically disordered Notch2-binding receptor 1 [Colossoma macropomum]